MLPATFDFIVNGMVVSCHVLTMSLLFLDFREVNGSIENINNKMQSKCAKCGVAHTIISFH